MEIIRSFFKHDLRLKDYLPSRACFFDIETTGFSRQKNIVYLVGVLYFEDNQWVLDQFFLNNLDNEAKLLRASIEFLNSFDKIISYNGDAFDIGFLNARAHIHGLSLAIEKDKSLDLYRILRPNKDLLQLENLKLKTVEESLGIFREDIYSGQDCIGFYQDYIVSKNLEAKDLVLRHNNNDLYHMLDLLSILDLIDEKKSFKLDIDDLSYSFRLKESRTNQARLLTSYRINRSLPMDIKHYAGPFSLYTRDRSWLYLDISLEQAYIADKKLIGFIDLRNLKLDKWPRDFQTSYDLPAYIYPLELEKKVLLPNIIALSQELLAQSLKLI